MRVTTTESEQEPEQSISELDRLFNREEVLQICYWYQGEGFGDTYNPTVLGTFLNCGPEAIGLALVELHEQGYLDKIDADDSSYRFSAEGKKRGGQLFADNFSHLQKAQHGECAAGCCDGDDHSQCGDDCALR